MLILFLNFRFINRVLYGFEDYISIFSLQFTTIDLMIMEENPTT